MQQTPVLSPSSHKVPPEATSEQRQEQPLSTVWCDPKLNLFKKYLIKSIARNIALLTHSVVFSTIIS